MTHRGPVLKGLDPFYFIGKYSYKAKTLRGDAHTAKSEVVTKVTAVALESDKVRFFVPNVH